MDAKAIGRTVERPAKFGPAEDASTPEVDTFRQKYPALYGFLAKIQDTPFWQKTGSMTVFWEDGSYKLCLNDRPAERSAFVSGASLALALKAADTGIQSSTVRWRSKGYKRSRQQQLNI